MQVLGQDCFLFWECFRDLFLFIPILLYTMANSYGFNSHIILRIEGSVNCERWKVLCTASLKSVGMWKLINETGVGPVGETDEKDSQF